MQKNPPATDRRSTSLRLHGGSKRSLGSTELGAPAYHLQRAFYAAPNWRPRSAAGVRFLQPWAAPCPEGLRTASLKLPCSRSPHSSPFASTSSADTVSSARAVQQPSMAFRTCSIERIRAMESLDFVSALAPALFFPRVYLVQH